MPTLFNIYALLSFVQFSTPAQALGLEALTPCVLTASNGAVVQAYCEESITPCVLTASNGAIVSAYCERNLVIQPFASITGISVLQNTTNTHSNFQVLGTDTNTISFSDKIPSAISSAISLSLTSAKVASSPNANPLNFYSTHVSPASTNILPSAISLSLTSTKIASSPNATSSTFSNSQVPPASTNTPPLPSPNSSTITSASLSSKTGHIPPPASTNTLPSLSPNSSATARASLPYRTESIPPPASLTPTAVRTTIQPNAQPSATKTILASTPLAPSPYCGINAIPDYGVGSFCTCGDGKTYTAQTQGSTPASLFNPCPYTFGGTPQTTIAPDLSDCEFDGPANCTTTPNLNIQSIINQANETYVQEEISNCSTFTARAGYPGVLGYANGDSCIEYFNITSHMLWWWSVNEDHCTNDLNVGFANCFYDITWDQNSNCSDLSANWYCAEPNIDDFPKGVNQTLDFYVAWNIYNYATWSFAYWSAMQYAYSYTTAMVWNDTLAFEHIKTSFPIGLEVLFGVCTFALGLISPSGWGKELPGKGGQNVVNTAIEEGDAASTTAANLQSWILTKLFKPEVPGEYLLRAAQQTPGLIHTILVPADTGTINAAIYSSAELTAQLTNFAQALSQIIEDVAVSVPDNATAFAEWTSTGYYMVEPLMNEQDMVSYIKAGLNTYIISQVLQSDDVFIVRQLDTNPYELQHNSSAGNLTKPSIIGCDWGYNEWNQCGAFWWDETNNVAYALSSTNDLWANYSWDLTVIFDNNLTTPEALFLGSQFCQDGYNATADQGPTQNLASGMVGLDTACLSDMAVCTWNLANETYEFVEPWCNTGGYMQVNYDFPDCAADDIDVPIGYLGSYLFDGATCESEE